MSEEPRLSARLGALTRLWAALIVPDAAGGWVATVPDLPGFELRGRTAYEVELALPSALAAALPAKTPRPVAQLVHVPIPATARWMGRPTPEAVLEARSAIRRLLAARVRPGSDLVHALVAWDRDLVALLPPDEPCPRPGLAMAVGEGILAAYAAEDDEDEDEDDPPTSANLPS